VNSGWCEELGSASGRSSREMAKMENVVSYTLSTENNRSKLVDGDLHEEDDSSGGISKFMKTVE
jgi:hypothetical protein